jgi:hypothetical protein
MSGTGRKQTLAEYAQHDRRRPLSQFVPGRFKASKLPGLSSRNETGDHNERLPATPGRRTPSSRGSASKRTSATARDGRAQSASEQGTSDLELAVRRLQHKGNRNRKGQWIYHVPGMPYYDATRAEEVFCTEAEARAAGYRRAIVR